MTTNATDDPSPDAQSDVAIEPAIASEIQPDLESRIKERRAALISKLGGLRGDTRLGVSETRDRLKATLSDLAHVVKWGIVDGWASVGVPVTHKLERWLTDSAHQLVAKSEQP
jgi:hypothetical protein